MAQGRSTSVLQELFAARQVYVRSGPISHYVVLPRSLQIAVAIGLGVVLLWLALASYAAIAKHLETLAQARELARLESVTRTLRTTVEEARGSSAAARRTVAVAEVAAELSDARAARERARTLAEAAAGEAGELRQELALAHDQIRELKCDLARAEAARRAITGRIAELERGASPGQQEVAGVALAGQLMLADPGCPPR